MMEFFDISKVDLDNSEFQNALQLIKHTQQSLFLTGKAGTGKSTFLKYICATTKKKFVVLAPTGVAAVNSGGVTIHSFFKMPFRPMLPDDEDLKGSRIYSFLKYSKSKIKLIENTELIIIDEISMVRADVVDFIDRVLRVYSHNMRQPFGGKQVLFVGDLFQLEPVVSSDERQILSRFYPNNFFFSANVFKNFSLVTIELQKVYRQKDSVFINILDNIRINNISDNDLQLLNTRCVSNPEQTCSDFAVTLATKRDVVDYINQSRLDKLESEEFVFKGMIEGDFPKSSLPTSEELVLKEGAQVIFIKNDFDKRWYNGSVGKITRITSTGHIYAQLENGEEYEVEKDIWNNVKYKYDETKNVIVEEMLGSFRQYPIKLAWAITVHKSQGLTFDNVILDFSGGVFAGGQTYVALSRCRSLEGIVLKRKISKAEIFVNRDIVDFSKQYNNQQLIDKVMKQSKADILYADSAYYFDKRKFGESLDKFIEAMYSRYDLEKPIVKRLIRKKLSVITVLENRIKEMEEKERVQHEKLKDLAHEFMLMGNECRLKLKDKTAAIANFNKAILLNPKDIESLVFKGIVLYEECDYTAAEECFNRAIELSPLFFKARFARGKNRIKLKNYEGAYTDLDKACSVKPEHKMTHELLYETCLKLGLHEQALLHYRLANPDLDDK